VGKKNKKKTPKTSPQKKVWRAIKYWGGKTDPGKHKKTGLENGKKQTMIG